MNEPTQIVYKPVRPDFSIKVLRSTSTERGYHETRFEVVSRRLIDQSGWKCLDAVGLIGMGQAYYIEKTESFKDKGVATLVSRRTGEEVPGQLPEAYAGREVEYDYTRYTVLRVMDSGD